MNEVITSNDQLIETINGLLKAKKGRKINIINDKLTLSVFSELSKNLSNVDTINLIIRNTQNIPGSNEVPREFEIQHRDRELFFNAYDIIQKNKLQHFAKAKSMYTFIQKHVNVHKTKEPDKITGNIIMIDDEVAIHGTSSLELAKKTKRGDVAPIHFNSMVLSKTEIEKFQRMFQIVWNNPAYTEDYKEQLLESLNYVYKDYSPEFLYYFTLKEIFGEYLDSGIDRFEKDKSGFKKTIIWNSLYEFQKDAVVSAIQKINKYNGCIIADSVGLGKTFEALAVIKYFELREDNVLVLCPAKLYDNWDSFKNPYVDNAFVKDNFNYKILCHTDLTRTKGYSKSGIDLARINWSNFDLVVIDESHNFRNRNEDPEHQSRYMKLLNDIIKRGRGTKVLLLSATPVNNSLVDLKNQINIITADQDHAFEEAGISSLSNLLRKAQKEINDWMKDDERTKNALLDRLPGDFFKLLEMLTISRSRRHITAYYGNQNIGKFPEKLPPKTYYPEIDTQNRLLSFQETNEVLESLKLAVYAPMTYIKSEYKEYYRKKYQTVHGDRVLFYHESRELINARLHRFNLFKRLESSVFAFSETIRRLLARINDYIDAISRSQSGDVQLEGEDYSEEDVVLNYKYEIKVEHLIAADFLEDLYYDKNILEGLYSKAQQLLNEKRDAKLKKLEEVIVDKIIHTPYNQGNRKILIFTAFADTANYLYRHIAPELSKHQINVASITGSGEPRTTMKQIRSEFNTILRHFSPLSKLGQTLPKQEQIDVVIATDCISEGQNLQDCDTVINYDIQWNPVVLIQRFGRIDRIGSQNKQIAMINFFPNLELNEYLQLEQRVKGKMMAVNLSSTGDEDFLSPEMNDFIFRKRQLERLQEEVIEIDELNDNLSLTDLNMNDYLYELSGYVQNHPEINRVPPGVYSIVDGEKQGCLFCFRYQKDKAKPATDSSIYPYYVIYISKDGQVYYGNHNAREALKAFRKMAVGRDKPDPALFKAFNKRTKNAEDMSVYSHLLNQAIAAIQGDEERKAEATIFDFGGYNNEFANTTSDDFELISFLVVE
ncbi:snf2 family RNA helicase [Heliomicrobium modesticaldum Ice1]|uniref:Snf2 family RNA helicase n=1 Tax=Heliobacterium modesticaldum (strain ATCC 51547 / Ice1) TaxID=498761 RepID=B0TDJ0_HELMI|nr:helicase-related protein [Heliomicrobium modesticaldum]ABZ85515.1 snf2 family RNA helicase [Heliomicrobium modesticaldum Ice1]